MAHKQNTSKGQETVGPTGLDQIREIIVGEQLVAWEKRFSKLEKALAELHATVESGLSRLEQQLDEKRQELAGNVRDLSARLGKDVNDLSGEIAAAREEFGVKISLIEATKVDRDSIGEVFIQWGQKVKAQN